MYVSKKDGIEIIHEAVLFGTGDFEPVQIGILSTLFSKLKGRTRYTVSLKEIEKFTGKKLSYEELKKSVIALGHKEIEWEEEEIDGLYYTRIWLFQSVKFKEKPKSLGIHISEPLYDILHSLKKNISSTENSNGQQLNNEF